MGFLQGILKKARQVENNLNPFDAPARPQPASTARPQQSQGGLSMGQPQQQTLSVQQPTQQSLIPAIQPVQAPKPLTVGVAAPQELKVDNTVIKQDPNARTGIAPAQPEGGLRERLAGTAAGVLSSAAKQAASATKTATDVRFLTPNFIPGVSQFVDPTINKISNIAVKPFENARQNVADIASDRDLFATKAGVEGRNLGNKIGTVAVIAPQIPSVVRGGVEAVKAVPKVVKGAEQGIAKTTQLVQERKPLNSMGGAKPEDIPGLRRIGQKNNNPSPAPTTKLVTPEKNPVSAVERGSVPKTTQDRINELEFIQGQAEIGDASHVAATEELNKLRGKTESGFKPLTNTPDVPSLPIVGQPITNGVNPRGFAANIERNTKPDNSTAQAVIESIPGYKPITNAKTVGKAATEVNKDPSATYARLVTKPQLATADDVATGNLLLRQAVERGDTEAAIQLGTKLGIDGTKLGQAVQAYSTFKRTTPEGIVTYASKQAGRGGKDLDPVATQELIAAAKRIADMPESFERAKATRELLGNAEKLGGGHKDLANEVFNAPRAVMATADFSAPGRQGAILGSRFPKQFAKSVAESAKYMFKPEYYEREMYNLTQRPTYALMRSRKLAVNAAEELTGTEEQFLGNILEGKVAKKLGIGHVIAGSDRAYSGFLTKFRADVFDKILVDSKKAGLNLGNKELDSLTKFINSASGRGSGTVTDQVSRLQILFSARLWKSRLDTLNPAYYARLDPLARKYALQAAASFAAITGTLLGLAKASGVADVEADPRSADFGKIKVGNTRYDILGGLQQNIRLASQLATGKKINSETGEIQTLGADRGYGKPSRYDLLTQFAENKENPILAFGTKVLKGTDPAGNPINLGTEAGKLAIPLTAQSIYSTAEDTGSIPQAIGMNAPGTFGVGVQTYGSNKTKDQSKTGDSSLANTLEQKKISDKKRTQDLKNSLSKEDYGLSQLSDKEQKQLVSDGVIDQNKIDGLKGYIRNKKKDLGYDNSNAGLPKNYDKLDPKVQKFYDSKSSDDDWKNSETDSNGRDLIRRVNQLKSGDLPDVPDNNKVASLYADFDQKRQEEKWSPTREVKEKQKLLQNAYKTDLSEDDKYWLGASDGLFREAIDNGDIDTNRLDKLVGFDNLQATLGGTAQIGKTVRRALGYPDPPTSAYGSTKYSSTGGSTSAGKKAAAAAKKSLSDFITSTQDINSAGLKNQSVLLNLVKGSKIRASGKNLNVTKVALKKQSAKRQKAKA